jgi:hypothetical protein
LITNNSRAKNENLAEELQHDPAQCPGDEIQVRVIDAEDAMWYGTVSNRTGCWHVDCNIFAGLWTLGEVSGPTYDLPLTYMLLLGAVGSSIRT